VERGAERVDNQRVSIEWSEARSELTTSE